MALSILGRGVKSSRLVSETEGIRMLYNGSSVDAAFAVRVML